MKNKVIVIVGIFLLLFVTFDVFLVYRFLNQGKSVSQTKIDKKQPVISSLNFPINLEVAAVTEVGVMYTIEGAVKEIRPASNPTDGYRIQLNDPTGNLWNQFLFVDKNVPVSLLVEKKNAEPKDIKLGDLLEIKYFWDLKDGGLKDGKVVEIIIKK